MDCCPKPLSSDKLETVVYNYINDKQGRKAGPGQRASALLFYQVAMFLRKKSSIFLWVFIDLLKTIAHLEHRQIHGY